uniref:Uncharacterized protein n=1 Tax=Anabas testudineus TaxID=64144 RepID=A0A3Q1J4S0_ANATE
MTNIQAGFQASGIYPLNREVFPQSAFAPAFVTDRPNTDPCRASDALVLNYTQNGAPTIHQSQATNTVHSSDLPTSSGHRVTTPVELRPFPKAGPRKETRKRKKLTILHNVLEKLQSRKLSTLDIGALCSVKKGPRFGQLCDCHKGSRCNYVFLKCL